MDTDESKPVKKARVVNETVSGYIMARRVKECASDWIECISFSADSRFVVIGARDKSVQIWDFRIGSCVRTLQGHSSEVLSVSFSADGRFVASGSADKSVKIWEASTGSCVRTLQGHSDLVLSVSFSADGRFVASGSEDRSVKIWEASTGKCVRTLQGHSNYVTSASFSPDGQSVVSGSWDTSVKIWEVSTGKCVRVLKHRDWVRNVMFSADGHRVASSSRSLAKIWDVSTGECTRTIRDNANVSAYISLSSDFRFAATGTECDRIKVVETTQGLCAGLLRCMWGGPLLISFSADDRLLAGVPMGRDMNIWNLKEELPGIKLDSVLLAGLSEKKPWLVTGLYDPRLFVLIRLFVCPWYRFDTKVLDSDEPASDEPGTDSEQ